MFYLFTATSCAVKAPSAKSLISFVTKTLLKVSKGFTATRLVLNLTVIFPFLASMSLQKLYSTVEPLSFKAL